MHYIIMIASLVGNLLKSTPKVIPDSVGRPTLHIQSMNDIKKGIENNHGKSVLTSDPLYSKFLAN